MNISELKSILLKCPELKFRHFNGMEVPSHFHITEAGLTSKHFIDCGGKLRTEKLISFQIWVASDTEHRLLPDKLLKIISLAEPLFEGEDLEIEVEYQSDTIGKYGLEADKTGFLLTPKLTNCLAMDSCIKPAEKIKINIAEIVSGGSAGNGCSPSSGCC
jgi:hypothetical protein